MSNEWLEYMAKKKGITVDEMRQEMQRRSTLVNPKKRGLAGNKEAAKRASALGNKKRWGKIGSGAEG